MIFSARELMKCISKWLSFADHRNDSGGSIAFQLSLGINSLSLGLFPGGWRQPSFPSLQRLNPWVTWSLTIRTCTLSISPRKSHENKVPTKTLKWGWWLSCPCATLFHCKAHWQSLLSRKLGPSRVSVEWTWLQLLSTLHFIACFSNSAFYYTHFFVAP